MINTDILEEENGQVLYLQTGVDKYVKCRFMWWVDGNAIEIKQEGQIVLIRVPRTQFEKLFHELPA